MTVTDRHIAIFGCGQLAQMTAQAGKALGLQFSFIAEPGEDSRCVDKLGPIITAHPHLTAEALFQALGRPDVFTVEKEMVNTQLLQGLEGLAKVHPSSRAVHITQNRIREKRFLQEQGIATATFEIVTSRRQLQQLPQQLAYPIYIKSAEAGYDGYHQWRIRDESELTQETLLQAVDQGIAMIAEQHVDYLRELSVIGVRDGRGEVVVYPLMENCHQEGVLLSTEAPAFALNPDIEETAKAAINKLMVALDYVGVLTIELFETARGLVANELAPRVHNSGHWTMEGSRTSQFENHCRAISDLPLGRPDMTALAGLVNILGSYDDRSRCRGEDVFYHLYGKEARPRRKLGHVTVRAQSREALIKKLDRVRSVLYADDRSPTAI
ncbi:MAG: 5-(carboxyamino)imidazole ribonucleotide synthase [Cellvibrionaceae bacterium]